MLVRNTMLFEVSFLLNLPLRLNTKELNSTHRDGKELLYIVTFNLISLQVRKPLNAILRINIRM